MKRPHTLALLCLSVFGLPSVASLGQSLPAGTGSAPGVGFQLPQLGGSLTYALSASELISTGFYNTGTAFTTNFNGDLAYLSTSVTHPFNAVYSGGVLLANSGQPNTFYQDLVLSQQFLGRKWNVGIEDSISELPESPVSGLSGIPGVGDLGVVPTPVGTTTGIGVGPIAGVGILTDYAPRVSNTLTATASRVVTSHVSAQATGYYAIQRFFGDNSTDALDSNGGGGSAGLSYHFSTLSALTVNYNYSDFSYPGTGYSYSAQGATVEYQRQWNRRFVTEAYVGPQYITATGSIALPSSTQIAAGASAGYSSRTTNYTASYSRGANNGSGVVPGSFSDNVIVAAHRQFGRVWNAAGEVGWSRTSSLPSFETYTFSSDAVTASGQLSRNFGRSFSGYATYTVERQSVSGLTTALDAYNGVYQVFGFGVSYSPRALNLGK